MVACGAKTRAGTLCKRSGSGAGGRCKFHGGASLAGPAHPNWKDGRHSKYLPAGLAARYVAGRNDPNLIALRDEVALVDVRVGELLEAIGETGNAKLWKDAREKFDAFKGARTTGPGAIEAARAALQQVDKVLTRGLSVSATWDELRDTLDLRRKLTEAETRRMKDLHQMISIERAVALMASLIDVVKENVTDRHAQAAIVDHFRRLVGRADAPPPAA